MKITFTTLLILGTLFCTNLDAKAQTLEQRQKIVRKYDTQKLEDLRAEFQREYETNYAKALALAAINNWPLIVKKPNHGFAELVGVSPQNAPIYYTTDNAGVAITSRADRLRPGGSLGLNLTGAGMVAGVWDGGKIRASHLDFGSRTFSFDQSNAAAEFHPTHVTGTIISSGANSSNNLGRGVAYGASAWYSDWSNDISEMASGALTGMLLSNHSYGLDASAANFSDYLYGAYIQKSKQLDDVMFNAPQYQAVVSAGNNRSDNNQQFNPTKFGYDLITQYATSKNAIVVAAVNSVANYTGPASVVMSGFSSYGPTDDGRIKPDIATKGVSVLSTTDNSNTSYGFSSGTSMSSPGITGTLLLVQQHYGNLHEGEFMNAATLKGLMVNAADEAGQYDGPDARFGWGLINAEKMAQTITAAQTNDAILSELTLSQGTSYTKTFLALGTQPINATIAWTDRGGTPNNSQVDLATPVLVNDLDIRITRQGSTYFPWRLDELPTDPAYKADNSVDNVEKIEIAAPNAVGVYTLTVSHKGTLVSGLQNYSLIVTGVQNLLSTADFNAVADVKVWPNPAAEVLNVSVNENFRQENTFVTVYDIQGRQVLQRSIRTFDANNISLDVSDLNSGMYIVSVKDGTNTSTTKFVKK